MKRRILALDGGGVRGAVTVAYLMRLEQMLSERAARQVRLCDCFDLIGGTSTGAIIATAIAFGFPAAEIKSFYFNLAPRVFKTSPLRPPGLRHVFDGELLRAEIHGIIGDATLGSDALKTGLAIITKRVDTGSTWIVTNNSSGKFWKDPQNGSYIGNREVPLVDLLRASTAAPHYFAPEQITIVDGMAPGLFVDGGVTAHNNPSMALFQLASIPGYGYNWPLGSDNLAILSLGTGSFRSTLDTAAAGRMPAALLAIRGLTGLIQESELNVLTMMQLLGHTPDPVPINSEIGRVSGTEILANPLFTFQRFDVLLEQDWLRDLTGHMFSAEEIEVLRAFDQPEIVSEVYDIADKAAQKQITAEHIDLFFGPDRKEIGMKPFCFILMPFGIKKDPQSGRDVNFDSIYSTIIRPAVEDAEMEPLRGDEEIIAGIIHKPMFERLMLCDFAVADLTTANANVFYELGIRHAARPHSTVLMFVEDMRLPFDVAPLRGVPYNIGADGLPGNAERDRANLAENLKACRKPVEDSPLFQLVEDWPRPDIARLKTDRFRDLVEYSQTFRNRLEAARSAGSLAVDTVAADINPATAEPAVTIDLLLSYRAVENWQAMIELIEQMPPLIGKSVLTREQLGFALNRAGRKDEAIAVLLDLIADHGTSSETCGILGRVYKDKWQDALSAGNDLTARGFLAKAIDTYVAGFDADMRDPYPGINAVTLMEMTDPVDARQADYLPVVSFVAARRLGLSTTDYWDHATMLELAILANHQEKALGHLADALASIRESWEPRSTANNLRLISDQRRKRGVQDSLWIDQIVQELDNAAQSK